MAGRPNPGNGAEGLSAVADNSHLHSGMVSDQKSTPTSELFQLTFDGRFPDLLPHVAPRSADRCPFCGHSPIVCLECGFVNNPCINCKSQTIAPENLAHRDEDLIVKRIEMPIIDPRRWAGEDFIGSSHGGAISRRTLDWLLSIQAGPFFAEPIAVNVAEITREERDKLEAARDPLPGVTPPDLEAFIQNAVN
ncbi:MAG: hypothetical protein JSS02_20710 [Planctomycetes bacterium]|nr:hypothetical protein [Planctomycetota bacterium]